ncbi:hypothetical protein GCM10022221_66110 [Actinocorallia aurea]
MRLLRLPALFGLTALTVIALGVHAPAAGASFGEPVRFSLEAASRPRAQHPELEQVKQRAKANGVSLGAQLRAEFGRLPIEKDGVYSPMTAGHCVPVGQVGSWYMIYQLHGGDGSSTTNVYSKLRHVGAYGDFSRFGPGTMSATPSTRTGAPSGT